MNEEDNKNTLTNDDMDVLRVLLHQVRGLSAVSTAAEYMPVDDTLDE
jgi:hypothetical protein